VDGLRVAGHDTAMAERELAAFQETLGVSQDHRAVIIKTIEQIDIVAECSDLIAKHSLDAATSAASSSGRCSATNLFP
jgi:hypothetical protein